MTWTKETREQKTKEDMEQIELDRNFNNDYSGTAKAVNRTICMLCGDKLTDRIHRCKRTNGIYS